MYNNCEKIIENIEKKKKKNKKKQKKKKNSILKVCTL